LTDTVGFIRNLPHQLVASFRATLGEIREADLILYVADSEREDLPEQIKVVDEVLDEIGGQGKPRWLILNKCDRLLPEEQPRLERLYPGSLLISALYGDGIEELKSRLADFIEASSVTREFELPSGRGDLIHWVYELGEVLSRKEANGLVHFTVKGSLKQLSRLKRLIERAQETAVKNELK
jgi:GTP-binding protein HflX